MRIKYLTEEGLDDLKENLVSVHGKHLQDANPDYFLDIFSKKGWLRDSKYEFPDVTFDMNSDFNISDAANIRNVFASMRSLPTAAASDERLWAGLAFSDMWGYVQYRRAEELADGSEKAKMSSFLFIYGPRRSSHIHCLSRLWWAGHMLYDPERDDPYELCDYFASRAFPSRMLLFTSSNFVSNPNLARGIVEAHLARHKDGKPDSRYPFSDLNKYLNKVGGITILDSFSRKEIFDIATSFLDEHFPGKQD